MTKSEAKMAIEEIIETARDDYEASGDEGEDGSWRYGRIDFHDLNSKIQTVIDSITALDNAI